MNDRRDTRQQRISPLLPITPKLVEMLQRLIEQQRSMGLPRPNCCAMSPSTYRSMCVQLSQQYGKKQTHHVTELLEMKIFKRANLPHGNILAYYDPRLSLIRRGMVFDAPVG